MAHYNYLIIGGGMTADSAVHGIRELDEIGTIAIVGSDHNPPYNRPPLTKGLWKGKPLDSIWRKTEDPGVELYLGRTVQSIDPQNKSVVDGHGTSYTYDKLLLAVGGTPRRLPFGGEAIIYYRTLDDYRHLRELAKRGDSFVVIGGGFIGSEIAAALTMAGKKVTMLFQDEGIGYHIYPRELSLFLNDFYRKKGVEVLAGESANGLVGAKNSQVIVKTTGGKEIQTGGVIAGIGIKPNIELAQVAGLQVGNGIVVDEYLHASKADIFAAGDVAEFANPALGKRIRVEHEDNANTMGQQAGRNMAGANEPYTHLPYFYSDLFELGYEAVGELDSKLETFVDWTEPFWKGVIYYLDGGRVRGVLLVNVWNQVNAARNLIAEPGPFKPEDLKGRLPVAD
jgi:3-phenylpropionate/trans-cinnamate dioxygenase ferredoxin reductase subunit